MLVWNEMPSDDADDLRDAVRRLADLVHARRHMLCRVPALFGHTAGFVGQARGGCCRVGGLTQRAGDLLQRRCRLLKVAGLALGAVAQVLIAGGDFAGRQRHAFDFAPHIPDDGLQIDVQLGHAAGELADFVESIRGHLLGQVTGAHALGHADGIGQWAHRRATDPPGCRRAGHRGCAQADQPMDHRAGRQVGDCCQCEGCRHQAGQPCRACQAHADTGQQDLAKTGDW